MRWVLADPSGATVAARDVARATGAHLLPDTWGAGQPPTVPEGADGLIVLGTDADLAAVAAQTRLPLLLVPRGHSDLLRMFAVAGHDPVRRLRQGTPYPTDLGWVGDGPHAHPFVAHAIVSHSGRLPRWWTRRRPIALERGTAPEPLLAAGVAIVNAQHAAGRTIAPRSALMDGVADLHVFTGSVRHRMAGNRLRAAGLESRNIDTVRRRVSRIVISGPRDWRAAADGVVLPGAGPWTMSIEPAAYTLWV